MSYLLAQIREDVAGLAFRVGQDVGEIRVELAKHDAQIEERTDHIEQLRHAYKYDQHRQDEHLFELSDEISGVKRRLDALEASTRGWTEKDEVEAVNRRLEALEARVALCGGISETKSEISTSWIDTGDTSFGRSIRIDDGEGPILRSFVNWLTEHYGVIDGMTGSAKLITKEQLIGEYLVYRAGFGGE